MPLVARRPERWFCHPTRLGARSQAGDDQLDGNQRRDSARGAADDGPEPE